MRNVICKRHHEKKHQMMRCCLTSGAVLSVARMQAAALTRPPVSAWQPFELVFHASCIISFGNVINKSGRKFESTVPILLSTV